MYIIYINMFNNRINEVATRPNIANVITHRQSNRTGICNLAPHMNSQIPYFMAKNVSFYCLVYIFFIRKHSLVSF